MKLVSTVLGTIVFVASVFALVYGQQESVDIDNAPPPQTEDPGFGSPELDIASQKASDLTLSALATENGEEREDILREVAERYTLLHESNPDQPAHINNRGVTYMFMEDYEKAISDFSVILAQYPKNLSARSNRAIAYKDLGRLEEAAVDYQIYIALVENHPVKSRAMGKQLELMRFQFSEIKEALIQQGIDVPEIDSSS